MTGLQLFPVVLSLLVLGAHFLRGGSHLLVLLVFSLLGLLAVRLRWAARVIQAALFLGTIEWIRTTVEFVALRTHEGQPIKRLVLILGSVALFTGLSALMFQTKRLRKRYCAGQ